MMRFDRRPEVGRAAIFACALCIAATLGGCGPVLEHGKPTSAILQEDQQRLAEPYRLQAADQLEVHHILDGDYSAVVVIAPDGKISVPGIPGQVEARGLTVLELTEKLNALYRQQAVFSNPYFSVNLRSFGNLQVFVGGEVQRPGYLELTGGARSILQVVIASGGFLPTARVNEIIVVRTMADGNLEVFSVNLNDVIRGRDLAQNVRIQPLDVVLVPKSDIASLDTWVEQYIRQVLPFSTSAGVLYTNNSSGVLGR